MDIEEIEDRIYDLEYEVTTGQNAIELAALYIIRDQIYKIGNNRVVSDVTQELDDILPAYIKYCDIKRRYQLNELTEQAVTKGLEDVCREIEDLIATIYSGTDMGKERRILCRMLENIHKKYCK